MKNKITKQDKIEASNLLEEASEIMADCINCGLCKGLDPVFRVLREERVSGRGQAILLRNKVLTQSIFESSLSNLPERICPKKIKISQAILKAREAAVILGKGLKSNELMIENIRKYGNPYGELKGDKVDRVYS